jgi:hypothetical protein
MLMTDKIKSKPWKLTAEYIMYAVAIANAFRLAWAYAYADADGVALSLPGGFGLLLGASVSIGTAFVASRIPGLKNKRLILAWVGLACLLIMEPAILAPLTYTDMPARLRENIPGLMGWGWSIVLALVPSLVMVSIAFANGGLVGTTQQATQTTTQTTAQPAKPKPQTWQDFPYRCEPCRVGYDKQTSLAAHMGHAKAHKAQTPAAYAVSGNKLVPLIRKGEDG